MKSSIIFQKHDSQVIHWISAAVAASYVTKSRQRACVDPQELTLPLSGRIVRNLVAHSRWIEGRARQRNVIETAFAFRYARTL